MSEHLEIDRESLGESYSYYPKLAKLAGGIAAGIFLGYLLEKMSSSEWEELKVADVERDTGLSSKEQELARKYLKNRNFLREKASGEDLQLSLNYSEFQEKLEIFEKLIFSSSEISTNSFNEVSSNNNCSEKIVGDAFFPAPRKSSDLTINPHYRFEGPWRSQKQFENFQKALLEHFKIQGLDNPMAYVFKIIDGMTKGIISPFWEEFIEGNPLGSSQKIQQEWEIEPGIPYPAFFEEIVQYYIHKGEPIEAATARANRELQSVDRAKSWWEGFLRKCDRLADEAIKAKELGLQTPYLPPSFSIRDRIDKQQIIDKLLFLQQPHSLPESSQSRESLPQTELSEVAESNKIEPYAPSLPILQKAYNTPLGQSYIARQIAAHPEWGYEVIDGKIVDRYPF
ncbi:MAG: hypothetical protein J7647_19975 [Cyanobacteria bacterium SBLK]|nr:hypothetical protein [Cyanobacteria bacterium SBLK]